MSARHVMSYRAYHLAELLPQAVARLGGPPQTAPAPTSLLHDRFSAAALVREDRVARERRLREAADEDAEPC